MREREKRETTLPHSAFDPSARPCLWPFLSFIVRYLAVFLYSTLLFENKKTEEDFFIFVFFQGRGEKRREEKKASFSAFLLSFTVTVTT
jgi:hypothetical protein